MSESALDSLFQDFEQILDEDDTPANSGPFEDIIPKNSSENGTISLGLGLAMTARFVRLNAGQISIDSEVEEGTKVAIRIPFPKARPEASRINPDIHSENFLPTPPLQPPDTFQEMVDGEPASPRSVGDPMSAANGQPVAAHFKSSLVSNNEPATSGHLADPIGTSNGQPLTDQFESTDAGYNEPASPGNLEDPVSKSSNQPVTRHFISPQRNEPNLSIGPISPAFQPREVTKSPTFDPNTGRVASSEPYNYKVSVLIAEDNPLNSRLLETRLRRRGHHVVVSANGRACAEAFKNNSSAYDVILMDLQMPLVDGTEATRFIRTFEREQSPRLSEQAIPHGRIPIIAVSASLSETARHHYMDDGFDGWIPKPINFNRLEAILSAIPDQTRRTTMMYGAVKWDEGGWFKLMNAEAPGASLDA